MAVHASNASTWAVEGRNKTFINKETRQPVCRLPGPGLAFSCLRSDSLPCFPAVSVTVTQRREEPGKNSGVLTRATRPGYPWDCASPDQQPHAITGVESSLRVTHCRLILQSLPEHNYTVLRYLMGFLHEVSGG